MAKLVMVKEKVSGLDGRTYSRWIEKDSTEARPFRITASASGMRFEGTMQGEIENMEELQEWAKLTSDVWVEHTKLRHAALANISRPS